MPGSYSFPAEDHPDSPWPIFERVLDFPELETQCRLARDHEVRFAFVMRRDFGDGGWTKGQRMVLGTAQMPRVTGGLADLFDQLLGDTLGFEPDFLIVLNGDWWEGANDREREILVVHELLHCGQALDAFGAPKFRRTDNAPILAMIGHDIEEFDAVARRYGAWKSDLVAFREALEEGEAGPARDNGAPAAGLAEGRRDHLAEIDAKLFDPAEVIKAPPSPMVDAPLPPNVDLHRGNLTQDESTADLF